MTRFPSLEPQRGYTGSDGFVRDRADVSKLTRLGHERLTHLGDV